MIVWLTTYIRLHRSTLPTLHRMMTSSGRLVDPRVPRRWTPRFLLLPRSWSRTSHDRRRADDPTPAGLASAATSAFFLRWSGGGTPFDFNYIERRYVEHYILHNRNYFSIFLFPTIICMSILWSKRGTFRNGTVISSIREHFSSVWHLSEDTFRDSTVQLHLWEMEHSDSHLEMDIGDVRTFLTYVFWRRTYFHNVRILVTYVFWRQHLRRWRTRIPSTHVGEHTLWIPRIRSKKNASDSF